MKKLITLIAIGMVAILVKAAPALRMPMTVTQPDGTTLTVEQFGDEHHHWTATTDGTMVINTGHGYYVALINDQGETLKPPTCWHMKPTSATVGNKNSSPARLPAVNCSTKKDNRHSVGL